MKAASSDCLPTYFQDYAHAAIDELGYTSRDHVEATLYAAEFWPLFDAMGDCTFDLVAGWRVLQAEHDRRE